MKRQAALFTIALALGTTMLVPRTDAQAPATNAAGLSFTTIDVPFSGVLETQAIGINNRGQIVGNYITSGGLEQGFLDDRGAFSSIVAPFPGTDQTLAFKINDKGQIVGIYHNIVTGAHGFVDDNGKFSPIDVPFSGAHDTSPLGINNRDQIVGAYVDAGGIIHGFLAGPCFAQGMPVLRLDDDGNPVFLRVRCKDDDHDQEHGQFSER